MECWDCRGACGLSRGEFREGQSFTGIFPRPGSTTDDIHSSIQAIDPKTGQKKWTYRLSAPATEAGVLTTASDVLFSGGRDGSFFALDARNGKRLWQTNLGPSAPWLPGRTRWKVPSLTAR